MVGTILLAIMGYGVGTFVAVLGVMSFPLGLRKANKGDLHVAGQVFVFGMCAFPFGFGMVLLTYWGTGL